MTSRLKEKYEKEVTGYLVDKFGYTNKMQVPRLEKVIINIGIGEAKDNPKALESAVNDLTVIAGQKPIVTLAKKSIANFKLREGQKIGVKVTLRGERMYDFLDKLMNVALPRVRDFRGIKSTAFDGRGNYALGLKEQLIFPEIEYDKVDAIRGLNVVIVTTANTDEEAKAFLEKMGMPFAKN
ncbi:50S ribosomal protein L5 [Peptoniphilus raoultii]|uniref:50S ribosomal protein L5 n=1 Tax=Peptoniphilus raoultii TaxID=1776387 RepID=UPI0008DA844E|nr:50S ribosomal protein L5 [Peptoniphilus raoultii]